MQILRLAGFVVVWLGLYWLAAPRAEQAASAQVPPHPGLLVHEWGVMNRYTDVELGNADMRAEWDALPRFVYGRTDRRQLPQPELVEIAAPVVYFHSPEPVLVEMRVDFPGGRPAVWWPANTNLPQDPDRSWKDNFLTWSLQIKPAEVRGITVMTIPRGHWMQALRDVKADDVLTVNPRRRGLYLPPQKERFVYYDGLIPLPKGLEITAKSGEVSLRNWAKHPVFDVTVIDRRAVGKVRVARLPQLEGGAEQKALVFREQESRHWPAAGVKELVGQLQAAGLFEDEAQALANVWKQAFFETEGLTLFYRLSQAEYDRLLPLTVTPRPEQVARVLLAHHPHCEPDLAERVLGLVKELEAESYTRRVLAHKRLEALGRAAFVHMLRAYRTTTDAEVRARLRKLLEEFRSEEAFPR